MYLDADDVVALLEDAELLLHFSQLLWDFQLIGQVGVPALVHYAVHAGQTHNINIRFGYDKFVERSLAMIKQS